MDATGRRMPSSQRSEHKLMSGKHGQECLKLDDGHLMQTRWAKHDAVRLKASSRLSADQDQ